MNKTPETDEAQHEGLLRGNPMPTQVVHVNFARKPEQSRDEWAAMCGRYKQERDEARKDAINLRRMSIVELMGENLNVNHHVTEWENRCLKAERERDEAREELRQWQTLCLWGGTPEHVHDFIKGQQTRIHEAQDIEKTCEQLERERDEANELLASEKITRNHIINRSVEVERERDEAREEIRDWKRLYDAAERGVDLTIAEGTISDLLKQRDEARELVKAYQEYTNLLGDEINDMTAVAYVHGWRTNRYEEGKVLRDKIKRLEGAK